MSDKVLEASALLDIYGGLLTEKQREALDMQLNFDYSLAEIAENQHCTRQAAQDAIKKGMARLVELESKLHIDSRVREMEARLDAIERRTDDAGIAEETANIRRIWEDNNGV